MRTSYYGFSRPAFSALGNNELRKRANTGQWLQRRVDGGINGAWDGSMAPTLDAMRGVWGNMRQAGGGAAQFGRGNWNAGAGAVKTGLGAGTAFASAPWRMASGAFQGGMQGWRQGGTIGSAVGGYAQGGLNAVKGIGGGIVNNVRQGVGGVKDMAQGGWNTAKGMFGGMGRTLETTGRLLAAPVTMIAGGVGGAMEGAPTNPPARNQMTAGAPSTPG
jgi:hypothetical protein